MVAAAGSAGWEKEEMIIALLPCIQQRVEWLPGGESGQPPQTFIGVVMEIKVGITGVLTVVFIILKLVGVICWSWWWVTAPAWGGLGISLLIFALLGLIVAGANYPSHRR